MRRRFFVDEIRNGHAHIEGDDAHHLTRVLRVAEGQHYEISDNHNVYLAEVETARKSEVTFRTMERLPQEPERVRITLCMALIKFDPFEWMIEKATELGVAEIVPVIATRTERGLELAAAKRIERWRRIAMESSQQSRRAFLPVISEPDSFTNILAMPSGHRYMLDEVPGGAPLLAALPKERRADDTVSVMIGPEGGWTETEREQARVAGWMGVTMGPLILRAETAAAAALAVVQAAWLVH